MRTVEHDEESRPEQSIIERGTIGLPGHGLGDIASKLQRERIHEKPFEQCAILGHKAE